ncbi:hypothetical protein LPJ66_000637 [Kickxella alabastrina]|uniref:Uncharacterized protein n=1 Tax=Kickxella alabastrina TaxID=61397 RepID=A0ACC1IVT3_9FUNG|nr:hypothetical protein LPJ66_000637 [Kickxella alabastrina]
MYLDSSTHIYSGRHRTKFGDKKFVLGLSWTPVNCQPEGAVYDVLEAGNISGVPTVYRSGILHSNLFGYRLEFLIMEDCGKSVWSTVESLTMRLIRHDVDDRFYRLQGRMTDTMQSVCTCLGQAKRAGVLHRDTTPDNITWRGKDTLVIN